MSSLYFVYVALSRAVCHSSRMRSLCAKSGKFSMSDRQNHSLNLLDLVICIAAVFKLSVSIKISLARLKILVKTQEIIALTTEIP